MSISGRTIHESLLRELCRLCGSKKALPLNRRGLPNSKDSLQRDVKKIFDIDFAEDDQTIHPPFICDCCRIKLNKWRKKFNSKRKDSLKVEQNFIQIYPYEKHTDSCTLCEKYVNGNGIGNPNIIKCANQHGFSVEENEIELFIFKVSESRQKFSYRLVINRKSREWMLYIQDVPAKMSQVLKSLPEKLDDMAICELISTLSELNVCKGNVGFYDLCRSKSAESAVFFSNGPNVSVTAFEETGFKDQSTIRHSQCELLLLYGETCTVCEVYRGDLKSIEKRISSKSSEIHPSTPNALLNPAQRNEKILTLTSENRSLKRKILTIEEHFANKMKDEGQELPEDMSRSFAEIINSHDKEIGKLPDESPEKLLWTQQIKYMNSCNSKGMRWHPTIIKWCIAIHSKSSKAYDCIRESGFLHLPHSSTLRDYSNFGIMESGINMAFLDRIKKEVKFESLEEFQRNVVLIFDEVKVKEGLVYCSESGELIGFTNLGSMNNEIDHFLNSCKEEQERAQHAPKLATHVIAFMVRGLFTRLHQVFAYYPCTGFNSHQLYFSVWQAIGALEYSKFHVRAITCDGASPNRKFFRIHGPGRLAQEDRSITFFAENPFRKGQRIYFICDPPHLMKTTRNNWENSGWHNKTRNLEFDGQQITWPQLVNLVEDDLTDRNGRVGGLRMLPKITNEHLRLTPSLRMRVKLATQVLSKSVAQCSKGLRTGK